MAGDSDEPLKTVSEEAQSEAPTQTPDPGGRGVGVSYT